jgi:hypothetical protein
VTVRKQAKPTVEQQLAMLLGTIDEIEGRARSAQHAIGSVRTDLWAIQRSIGDALVALERRRKGKR